MEDEDAIKTSDKPWLFKKGCMPGPGRPKGVGKSLKEYAREYLANMTEEERLDYLDGIDKKTIWEMSEGKPKQDTETKLTGDLVINVVKYGNTDTTPV